jgi:glycolate oxidase
MSAMIEAVLAGEREGDFSTVDKAKVVEALSRVLPVGALMYESEDLRPYECDGLAAYRRLPMVVALPTTEEQVVAILKICHDMAVPVVARGRVRDCRAVPPRMCRACCSHWPGSIGF